MSTEAVEEHMQKIVDDYCEATGFPVMSSEELLEHLHEEPPDWSVVQWLWAKMFLQNIEYWEPSDTAEGSTP